MNYCYCLNAPHFDSCSYRRQLNKCTSANHLTNANYFSENCAHHGPGSSKWYARCLAFGLGRGWIITDHGGVSCRDCDFFLFFLLRYAADDFVSLTTKLTLFFPQAIQNKLYVLSQDFFRKERVSEAKTYTMKKHTNICMKEIYNFSYFTEFLFGD